MEGKDELLNTEEKWRKASNIEEQPSGIHTMQLTAYIYGLRKQISPRALGQVSQRWAGNIGP